MATRTGEALEAARDALHASAPDEHVGQHTSSDTEFVDGAAVTTHTFSCTNPAYPGWYWAVATVEIGSTVTVSEVNLLPGAQALVPPQWQPWETRVQPGDLGVGDLLPTAPGDARLAPGFTDTGDADDLAPLAPAAWELGLGRESVLSPLGLELAVDRWLSGQTGPRAAMAKAAPAACATCGFLAPIGGSVGQAFGVCANAFGAADGQIVALTFGCGAHSSVRLDQSHPVPVVGLAIDDDTDELADADGLPEYQADGQEASDDTEEMAGGHSGDSDDSGDTDDDPDDDRASDFMDHVDEDELASYALGEQAGDEGDEDDQVDWSPTADDQ